MASPNFKTKSAFIYMENDMYVPAEIINESIEALDSRNIKNKKFSVKPHPLHGKYFYDQLKLSVEFSEAIFDWIKINEFLDIENYIYKDTRRSIMLPKLFQKFNITKTEHENLFLAIEEEIHKAFALHECTVENLDLAFNFIINNNDYI
eukprot:TRINITY_DN4549_c0_g1_i2.p1 TRINITY_DN4549_c0_g1~~TRINITY_DN4549_c0_g1_i2.p1  ORF type:complete len:149 (-),score=27.96 TRINITY_DN4549_c0_g1_i2:212-658(-)